MELWFWAAVGSAVFAGLSNQYFKIAAKRNYNSEVFSLCGVVFSSVLVWVVYFFFPAPLDINWLAAGLMFFGGFLGAFNGILKVTALRHIDTTIYFPLFKLLAPLLAIIIGVSFFGERFSIVEWIGLAFGLFVPLLLITKSENGRQQNLLAGLVIVLVTGVFSAVAAAFGKFATTVDMSPVVVYIYLSLGLLFGNLIAIWFKTGWRKLVKSVHNELSPGLAIAGVMRALLIAVSVYATLYAYVLGGSLAVVQTIHSMYILIPIILSIVIYKEHCNVQKVTAIFLSVAALALLG